MLIAKNHPFQKYIKELKCANDLEKILPEQICKLSNKGDILMNEIENIWLGAYGSLLGDVGSLLGDVALHELCLGGLWISGGTAPKHFKNFKSDLFLKQFSDKGRLKDCLPQQ